MDLQSDIKRLSSLLSSSILVSNDLIENLERVEKFLPDFKLIPKDCILSTETVNRLLTLSINLASRISIKSKMIEKNNAHYEESLQQLEKKYDSYLFEKNLMIQLIKIHQNDKKQFINQFIKTSKYSSSTSIESSTCHFKKNTQCNICLEDFLPNCDLAILHCGHYFHKQCAIEWLSENKSECSHCNNHIVPKELSTLEKILNSLEEDTEKIKQTDMNDWNIKVSKKRSRSNSYSTVVSSNESDSELEITVHDSMIH
jgi:hypothetical protein